MAQKKYASLSSLQTFLDNLKDIFSSVSHKHTTEDITDYAVDSQLSPISTNPVQNKILDAEFEAISESMNALDLAIDGKVDIGTLANYSTTTESQFYTDNAVAQKTQIQMIIWEDND